MPEQQKSQSTKILVSASSQSSASWYLRLWKKEIFGLALITPLLGFVGWAGWVRFAQAQAISDVALLLQSEASNQPEGSQAWQSRRDQLEQAVSRLKGIPTLPFLNDAAISTNLEQFQAELNQAETNLSATQAFDSAKQLALEAATIVQNPPHPLETWQQALSKWQSAVTLLEGIAPSSAVYGSAQERLLTYQGNLKTLEQRIEIEQKAAQSFASAQVLAKEAGEAVANPPHPAQTWQAAQGKWLEAVRLLEAIPSKTGVSLQAQERLVTYRANAEAISARAAAEQRATTLMNQANALFERAITSSRSASGTIQVLESIRAQLQQGIKLLEQVPQGTMVYETASQHLTHYQQQYDQVGDVAQRVRDCLARNEGTYLSSVDWCTETASVTAPGDTAIASNPFNPADSSSAGYPDSYIPGRTVSPYTYSSSSGSGRCMTPDDLDAAGRRCGARAASVRPGGLSGYESTPSYRSSGGTTYVRSYTRRDGTRVRGHTRRSGGRRR
jgi:hypothetical protein